ncbi:MAG: ABC transporter ATP-binding protein [candidate division WOR-3 bacterium]
MIEVRDLTKRFPSVLAVDRVSFSTGRGEVFGLLGPNGAGKTTTLRMILSILTPTSGRILIDGIDVSINPLQARNRIGSVLEDNGVYDRFTALENVLFFGRLYGLGEEEVRARASQLFATLDMTDFALRRAGTFSKGMKQKTAIARALIADPPVLVMDEPTAGLDVPTQRVILDLLKAHRGQGKTILYSTHIMSEAEELCDRVAIIDQGRLRAVGTLAELRQQTEQRSLADVFMKLVET